MKIAIASGKGGTGKTFVATNLLNALNHRGFSATLVDCDAEAPNAAAFFSRQVVAISTVTQQVPEIDTQKCTYCGKCHEFCSYNAIFFLPSLKIIKVLDDLCHSCGACTYACDFDAITEKPFKVGEIATFQINGHCQIIEARTKVGVFTPVPVIKAAIKVAAATNDFLIFDAPPGTSCPFIHTVSNADFVIIVTEPTPFGLSDLKQSVETLRGLDKLFGVIINRAGIGDGSIFQYMVEEDIPLLAEIPFDRQIAGFYSVGKIAGAFLPDLDKQLFSVFNSIIEKYANSHYQR